MIRPLEDIIFHTRVLAQGHPLSGPSQAYVNRTVARERTDQPVPEIGIWAGYAMTAGYCLRRVEEADQAGEDLASLASKPPRAAVSAESFDELDSLSSEIADAVRGETPEGTFLYPEDVAVEALDHLIAGEIERRLSHWEDTVDEETMEELESYIAWWTVKGYALRVAEQAPAQETAGG